MKNHIHQVLSLRHLRKPKFFVIITSVLTSYLFVPLFYSLSMFTFTSCDTNSKKIQIDSVAIKNVYEFKITEPGYEKKVNTYLTQMGLEKYKTEAFVYLARKYSLHSYRGSGNGELYRPDAVGISVIKYIRIGEVLLQNTALLDTNHDYGLLEVLKRLHQAKVKMAPYLTVWLPYNERMIQYDTYKPNSSSLKEYSQLKSEEQKIIELRKKFASEITSYESILKEIDEIISKIDLSIVSSKMLSPMYADGELLKFGTWAGGDTVGSLEFGVKW